MPSGFYTGGSRVDDAIEDANNTGNFQIPFPERANGVLVRRFVIDRTGGGATDTFEDSSDLRGLKASGGTAGGGSGATELNELTDVTLAAPADGEILEFNGTSQQWENVPAAGSVSFQPSYQYAATAPAIDVAVALVANEWRLPQDFAALSSISAYLETAPTGADMIIEVLKNAVVEATVTIVNGSQTGASAVFTSGVINAADVITTNITQVGSTIAGQNLKISIIDGAQTNSKSLQFATTTTGVDLATGVIADVWRVPTDITTLNNIGGYVEVAPVGAAITFDVRKNGTPIGTVTINDGAKTGITAVSDNITVADEITVEITQVGSTTAGQNLKVNVLGV